ncbi:MAG TPA: hypothetical protein VFX91_09585 [Alcanivorax sp.]|nr:hypothetical protein [Alcanivorax sp.]
MRFLLILTVTVAVVVLLWGSWQAGRKPFYLVLSGIAVAGALFLGAMLFTDQQRRVPTDPETVETRIDSVHETETTYRLRGEIINNGEHAVARTEVMAEALNCPPAKACDVLYGERLTLPMHIPAGGRYPLNLSVPRPPRQIQADRWRARVLRVEAYER